ncbi:hypothetical protein Gotri_025535 [Gossypium trilobum]|uniref:Protein N-terminal glutamine amidohydrolase n=1 Tax=Gossypium trilobum TaxID=34281 RepID=A0A7J9FNP0_9ROSI|nr:hypothetical protein [Gossypium trilobum]
MTTSELQLQPNNLDASLFNHTPFYCEENVYFLCKKLCSSEIADAQGSDLFVVFISNANKQARIFFHFFFGFSLFLAFSSFGTHNPIRILGFSFSFTKNLNFAVLQVKSSKSFAFLKNDGESIFYTLVTSELPIPLWHQKASHRADGVILWDYHVICVQRKKDGGTHLVWDLDSSLPFPCPLATYVSETIRPSFQLFSEFQRFFRVVHAPLFLRHFASDRRHMKDSEGNCTAQPPPYEPIVAEGTCYQL